MAVSSISRIASSRFGRKILVFFLLAGCVPVLATAVLVYQEIGRGQEQEAGRQLRDYAKSHGNELIARLSRLSRQAEDLVDVLEESGKSAIPNHEHLTRGFDSIWLQSGDDFVEHLHGDSFPSISFETVDDQRLNSIGNQLVIETGDNAGRIAIFLSGIKGEGVKSSSVYAFNLNAESAWRPGASRPFATDYCVFTAENERLFCSADVSIDLSEQSADGRPIEFSIDGEAYFAGVWQLFMDGAFGHPPVKIAVIQPKHYALRSAADFRRIFPIVLALVFVLVGSLSLILIGQSLVPLQRLTVAARRFASGNLKSRVRIRTDDEFSSVADAFNHMALSLGRQFGTMKVMSQIDSLLLSRAEIEEIAERIMPKLAALTGFEALEIISRDNLSPTHGKLIAWHGAAANHQRIVFPQIPDFDPDQPTQIEVAKLEGDIAPWWSIFVENCLPHVVVLPVVSDDTLKGALLVGSDSEIDLKGDSISIANDFVGRIAVALASVERDEALYRQAHFDELTGLPNRQLLQDRLGQQLMQARSESQQGAIFYLDLDRFKDVNDVFGHSVGDEVLVQAAARIVAETRGSDTVARLGGDEFVVVLPNMTNHNLLRILASRLLTSLAEPFVVKNESHFLGASCGIALFPADGDSSETLLKNADSAMYRAKDAGRSCFEFYSDELNKESRRKIQLEKDLRIALENGELNVFYQPQFEMHNARIAGAEALLRWTHSSLGNISPQEFVQLAEDSNLIVDLGRWVLEQVCADLRTLLDMRCHPGVMAFNVSAKQLREVSFPHDIFHTLDRYDIPPSYLQLELTETIVAQNRDTAITILDTLRHAGLRIAMDDFGTGYSSLSYLQQLPFDTIKIDKSFVELIGSNFSSERICRTIIKIADELGKATVAEGVENQAQADFLLLHGCGKAQGYHFSKPLPRDQFIDFIAGQELHTQRRKALEIVQ